MVLVKSVLCLILAWPPTLQFSFKATKSSEMAQKCFFLFGFHLTSSTFNGFVNHFAVSKKNEHLRKLLCTPARWRLLQLGLFLILFPEGRFSATALPGGCPVPARPLRLPLRLLLPLLLLPARRWCSRARVERRELVTWSHRRSWATFAVATCAVSANHFCSCSSNSLMIRNPLEK